MVANGIGLSVTTCPGSGCAARSVKAKAAASQSPRNTLAMRRIIRRTFSPMGPRHAACARIERGLASFRGRSERSNPTKESLALDITAVLFVLLAVGVVGGGLAVVTLRNVNHSAIAM